MLASLSPCLRQMVRFQKMLASLSPAHPVICRRLLKCLHGVLIRWLWTRSLSHWTKLHAGHDVAPSGVGIVLKSEFPTVCPAGIFETAARASSEKSVKSIDVKSCSSPVLCPPHH